MGLLCHSNTWLVGMGREGEREEKRRKKAIPEKELALCLWRQENCRSRTVIR